MARINADLSEVKDEEMGGGGGWSAWEQGDYRFMVEASEYNQTKAGNGMCLKLELVCLDPDYSGDKQWVYLTLEHPNPDTVRIAKAKLKELALAVGHPTPDTVVDSDDLHGIPFLGYVTKKLAKPDRAKYADKDGYENEVVGFKRADDGTAQVSSPSQDAPPASGGAPPVDPGDDIPF